MENLSQFIEEAQGLAKGNELREARDYQYILSGFKSLADFLSNHRRFPNHSINVLMTLANHLLETGEITVEESTDENKNMPRFRPISDENGTLIKGTVILPTNFLQELANDVVLTSIRVIFAVSCYRDAISQEFDKNVSAKRGRAYQGEAIRTFSDLDQSEGLELPLHKVTLARMNQYPDGLASFNNQYVNPQIGGLLGLS